MSRQLTGYRSAFSHLVALSLALTPSLALGATHPHKPKLGSASVAQTFTPLGETEFNCGTYKGNHSEIATRSALHLRNQKFDQGLRSSAGGLDYLYNNVWIIEDDGSLTLSGNNFFDYSGHTILFTNNGGGVYTVSNVAFSYDATLGTLIAPDDDGEVLVNLPFAFPFAGQNWNQMYVNGNGAMSFGAEMNPNGFYDNADFYSTTPKIAAYYLDLNEAAGGEVRVLSEAGKYTVTFISVREFGTFITNTFQLVMYPNGNFTITYNGIGSNFPDNGAPIITGYHPGTGAVLDEIDISASLPHVSPVNGAVFEQYYSFPTPLVDEVALFNRFYQQFPDDFFQIVFFTNFTQDMGNAFAYERNISNDVTGLGLQTYDASGQYGSNGVLESLCNMGQLNQWTSSNPAARVYGKGNNFLTIMAQEAGHRWGAFAYFDTGSGPSNLCLGRQDAHWSYYFDVDHSSLEGGNWVSTGGLNYTCPTTIDYFSEIDEYFFGLRTPNEVKDMFYISSPQNNTLAARQVGTPLMGANATGTFVPVTVENFIAAEGARTPVEADEEHDLRQAFIFLIAQGTTPTQQQLDKIAGFRAAWEEYFEKSCDGRLSCNTSLNGPYPVGVISGEVRNRYTQQLVPEFTANSIERTFSQHVPADGRFIFRYDDSPTRGTNEDVTIIFSAPGYFPDTLTTNIVYGQTISMVSLGAMKLTPIHTAAGSAPVLTELRANHPNPFNPSTEIEYVLGQAGPVRLDVYDAAGRRVRTLVDRTEAKGEHRITFDGLDDRSQPLASGVYLYRLQTGDVTKTRKMVLLK